MNKKSFWAKDGTRALISSLISIGIGLLAGAVVIVIVGLITSSINGTGIWDGIRLVLFGILMAEKLWIGKYLNKYKIAGHAYMFLIIPLTWLIFAVTDLHQLGIYFGRLFPMLEYVRFCLVE